MQRTSVWFDLGCFYFSLVFWHVLFYAVAIERAVLVRLFFSWGTRKKDNILGWIAKCKQVTFYMYRKSVIIHLSAGEKWDHGQILIRALVINLRLDHPPPQKKKVFFTAIASGCGLGAGSLPLLLSCFDHVKISYPTTAYLNCVCTVI